MNIFIKLHLLICSSFSLEAWLSLDSGYTAGPYPVICTADSFICLSVEGGNVVGRYGDYNVTSATSLTAGTWHNVILRYRIECK